MSLSLEDAEAVLQKLGRVGSYAPGNYLCRCGECQEQFTGDKRAFMCLPCAVRSLQQDRFCEAQKREQYQEEVDSVHAVLDANQVAKEGPLGKFSLVGRVLEFGHRHSG